MTIGMAIQFLFMAVSVAGMLLNNQRKTINFYFFIGTYMYWIILYFNSGLYGAMVKDAIFLVFNIQGLLLWTKHDREKKEIHMKEKCIDKCEGCKRVQDDMCLVYKSPEFAWRNKKWCPMATHVDKGQPKQEKALNPLKASKRRGK